MKKTFNRALLENHHEGSDEVQMAKIQLKSIMADAAEILQKIEGKGDLDSWIQSKLTMADDYLATIKKHLQFGEEEQPRELPLIPAGEDVEMPSLTAEMPDEGPSDDDLAVFSQKKPEDVDIHAETDLDDAEQEAEAEGEDEEAEEEVEDEFSEDDVPDGESMEDEEPDINESYIMPRLI